MPAYFFRSEPGAAELRRLARGESGRVCQRVLMIANMLEGMEHEEAARLAGLSRSAAYEWHNRYEEDGIEGLRDRPRPGRQPRVDAVTSARFKERIVAGAELQRDGVVAFRAVDAQRILKEEFAIDCSLSSTYRLLHRIKLSWLAPRPRHPMRRRRQSFRNSWIAIRASRGDASARCASRGMVSGRGSHWPEEQLDPGMGANRQPAGGAKRSRLRLGLFVWCGLPVAGQGGGADHADLQYRRDEPSPLRDQQPSRRRCPCRGDPRWCQLAQQPWTGGAQQYHFVGAAALQPGAQSSGAGLALSAQPLARQLGISQPGGHHGRLRDGVEPVRHQQRPGPLALRGRLGSSFARFIGGTNFVAEIEPTLASRNLRRSVLAVRPAR